jgi:hypothetical protein
MTMVHHRRFPVPWVLLTGRISVTRGVVMTSHYLSRLALPYCVPLRLPVLPGDKDESRPSRTQSQAQLHVQVRLRTETLLSSRERLLAVMHGCAIGGPQTGQEPSRSKAWMTPPVVPLRVVRAWVEEGCSSVRVGIAFTVITGMTGSREIAF